MLLLETDRLRLRSFQTDDVDHLVELDGDPEVMRYLTGGVPTPRSAIENEILADSHGETAREVGLVGRRTGDADVFRENAETI